MSAANEKVNDPTAGLATGSDLASRGADPETAMSPKGEAASCLFGPSAPRCSATDGAEGAGQSGGEDLTGLAYRGSDGAVTCALCDYEMEWEHCATCGGDGTEDAYEDDPINCAPGEEMTCRECHGRGGFYFCQTSDCKTHFCRRILKAKPVRSSKRGPNKPDEERPAGRNS